MKTRHYSEVPILAPWPSLFRLLSGITAILVCLAVALTALDTPLLAQKSKSTSSSKKKTTSRTRKATPKKKSTKSSSTAKKKSATTTKTAKAPAPAPPPNTLRGWIARYRATPSDPNRAAAVNFAARLNESSQQAFGLGLAVGDLDSGRLDAAIGGFEKSAQAFPRLADHAAFGQGRAHYQLKHYEAAITQFEKVLAFEPVSPHAAAAALIASRAALEIGDPRRALSILEPHIELLPAPAGVLTYGLALKAAGRLEPAAMQLQRVYYEYPTSKESAEAETALGELRDVLGDAYPPVPAARLFDRASRQIRASHSSQAIRELEEAIPGLPAREQSVARVKIGAAKYRLGQYGAAFAALSDWTSPDPDADAERLYWLLSAARRLDRWSDVDAALAALGASYPQSPHHLDALLSAADRYLIANDPAGYVPLYTTCYQQFPADKRAGWCHWRVVWSEYKAGGPRALSRLREHLDRFPESDEAASALYFLGRSFETSNDLPVAKAYYDTIVGHFPNYYYATAARERLAEMDRVTASPAVIADLASIPLPPAGLNADFAMDDATQLRIERARDLDRAGLTDWAEIELRFSARRDAKSGLAAIELATLAKRRGADDQAIRYIKAYAPDYLRWNISDAPDALWKLAFPIAYKDALEKYSKAQELDPHLVAGLIRQESEFAPKVVSRAKAIGLTQIMPATGRDLGRQAGIKRYSTSLLYEPEVNLRLGTMYIRWILNRLEKGIVPTLAGYNAGPTRARRWLDWGEYREPSEYIETIPLHETRNYVQAVIRNRDMYQRLYGVN